MRKLFVVVLLGARAAFAADFVPAIEWVKTIDATGSSVVAAAATDKQGNLYIAGSTSATDLAVVHAAQPTPGGSPLVRIQIGSPIVEKLYPPVSSFNSIAADPRNPARLYAAAGNRVWTSTDAGSSWTAIGQVAPAATNLVLAVAAGDPNTVYAGSNVGLFKSADGGMTFSAIDFAIGPVRSGSNYAGGVWVDTNAPQTVFAATGNGLLRTSDAGAHWAVVIPPSVFFSIAFDPFASDRVYASTGKTIVVSTDGGQTFTTVTTLPDQTFINTILADPKHSGVLYSTGYSGGIAQSTDGGATWTPKSNAQALGLAADPATGVLFADVYGAGILMSRDGFSTTTLIDPLAGPVKQIVVSGPYLFAAATASADVFVLKLDPDGNIQFATYFGGNYNDAATALTVGIDGSVYLTGTTSSPDFPVTEGAFQAKSPAVNFQSSNFVFKLNRDGSLVWSTLFADGGSTPYALAVDSSGNPVIAGQSKGNLPTTPGAYQEKFQQTSFCTGFIGCIPGPTSAFVTKLNSQGTALMYSTYVPLDTQATALALDADGDAYFGGSGKIIELNSTGTGLLAMTGEAGISIRALVLDPDGNVYATGAAMSTYNGSGVPAAFGTTPNAFQPAPQPATPLLPGQTVAGGGSDAFVAKWKRDLSQLEAATLLGGELADAGESIALDQSGNVVVSGYADSQAFPLRAPFQTSFSPRSGFVAGLDSNLSHLLFSTYLGDARAFDARATVVDPSGNLLLAGNTLDPGSLFIGGDPGQSFISGGLVVANKISLQPPPTTRLDAVQNLASRIASPITPGEMIVAAGSGFGSDAQILLDGVALTTLQVSPTSIAAEVPIDAKTSGAFVAQVSTGGSLSNPVLIPAAPASPGIYSIDGSGFGQGYILNADGTRNSADNPASVGSPITIYATGVGRYSLAGNYAVTEQTPSVFVDGFYANGIAATMGPVPGLPGDVYRIQVYVPDPSQYADRNPNLVNFKMPPQVGVKLVMGSVNSLNPDNSVSLSQAGLILNVR